MSLSNDLKLKVFEYIKQSMPNDMCVVERSIPVVFFGDIEKARVATISINPSNKEFEDEDGLLLMPNKRFVDRDVLDIKDTDSLDEEQTLLVYDSLINYFYDIDKNNEINRFFNPYKRWFNWLDKYAGKIFGTSFYDGSMVNLDIYPWATNPTWGKLDKDIKEKALQNYKLLKDILFNQERSFDYIYINGITVKEQIEKYLGLKIPEQSVGQWKIYKYELDNGTMLIGSSCYIQQSHKTTEELIDLHNILSQSI